MGSRGTLYCTGDDQLHYDSFSAEDYFGWWRDASGAAFPIDPQKDGRDAAGVYQDSADEGFGALYRTGFIE